MSGQVGSARTLAEYDSASGTLTGGFNFKVSSSVSLFANAVWSSADGSLDPFQIVVPADYLARNPNQSFDFTQTASYSDLDVSRAELELGGSFDLSSRLYLHAAYRYVDFEDDAPYLVDTTGSADFYALGVGYRF